MKMLIARFSGVVLLLVSAASFAASELQSYVSQCQTELKFNAGDVKAMNCNKGVRFDFGSRSPENDFLVYQRVNDTVDMVLACRWLSGPEPDGSLSAAASAELIIHNRQTGGTCFFSAQDVGTSVLNRPVSTTIVSPTNFGTTHPNADDFWLQPKEVNSKTLPTANGDGTFREDSARCVGCHSQGPYIASANIVSFLEQYGLLNNGHPTLIDMVTAKNYHAVGSSAYNNPTDSKNTSAFKSWDSIIYKNNVQNDCSGACHSLAINSKIGTLLFPLDLSSSFILLPSIAKDITDLGTSGLMAPNYDDQNDFRWINLDTPSNSAPSSGVETENFADAMASKAPAVPVLALASPPPTYTCPKSAVPSVMEAHALGVPDEFGFNTSALSQIPDRLKTFNLKEGLVCLNADQEVGRQCGEYSVRYLCSVKQGSGVMSWSATWSDWYNADSASGDGDHEERSAHKNICGGVAPIGMEVAQVATPNSKAIYATGPNDRLARISPYGLTCNNADQVDKQCSNYIVRYDYCTTPPATQKNKILSSAFVAGKEVTAASGSLAKGQAHDSKWNTQSWDIEPVTNTEYVRIHNIGSNVYLTVTSSAEQATVGTAALNSSTSEMWLMEPITGSTDVRFKNLYSGKYLTIADPKNFPSTPNFLPIYSQALNTNWSSQRWILK